MSDYQIPVIPARASIMFYVRLTLILLLLLGEIISMTTLFDFHVDELKNSTNLFIQFSSNASALLKLSISFVAAFLLLVSRRVFVIIHELRNPLHSWRLWIVIQILVCGVLIVYTSKILPASSHHIISSFDSSTPTEAKWFVGWFALGGLTLTSWLLAFASWRSWMALFRREYRALLIAICAAIVVWLGGFLSEAIGIPLANISLEFSHRILLLLFSDVGYDFDKKRLGLSSFSIEISPGCSGYEGIIMITVFIALYLWLFSKELKFPQVLCLFPLGIVAIWLTNIFRIVSMIMFGEFVSPEIALGGLHSQAGWINFTLIALALIAGSHVLFVTHKPHPKSWLPPALDTALAMPFLVMMALMMITSALSHGFETLYPIRIGIVAVVIGYYRSIYRTLAWGGSWQAVMTGVLVFVMWILLEPTQTDNDKVASLTDQLAKLPEVWMITWVVFRVLGSVIVIPIVEEFAFRGYLLRKLIDHEIVKVSPTQFTWLSFIVSSVLFGLLHGRWLAGTLAGMAFAVAVYRRGKIGDAILAHGVANALIAASVLILGKWSLWA